MADIETGIERIGIKALRQNLATHLVKKEPFAITKNGLTLGYYIPTHHTLTQEQRQVFKDIAAQFDAVVEKHHWDSEALTTEAMALRQQDKQHNVNDTTE
jgi:hypothetical protein